MKKDGFYTVEAALIMPFVMVILAAVFYLIFYIHDREVVNVYAQRMAQESCYLLVENENQRSKVPHQEIVNCIQNKYEMELQEQLLILKLDRVLGTCKKNILTHVYTATWNVVAIPPILEEIGQFVNLGTVICEKSYERVHGRQWMYGFDLVKGDK